MIFVVYLVLQRLFALSKASGQKAAQYVLQRYPQNFANDPAEPQIEVCFVFVQATLFCLSPFVISCNNNFIHVNLR